MVMSRHEKTNALYTTHFTTQYSMALHYTTLHSPWLVMNSHTPSLARIMNLSSGSICLCHTSGRGITPTEAAMRSPVCACMRERGEGEIHMNKCKLIYKDARVCVHTLGNTTQNTHTHTHTLDAYPVICS
jgi:hypothetical protein